MFDPYVYQNSDVLINLANISDKETVDKMEADYSCLRLAQIAMDNPLKFYEVDDLKKLHYIIFQDIYDWAGEFRTIDIEKEEPALGGLSIEYSQHPNIRSELYVIFEEIRNIKWSRYKIDELVVRYTYYLSQVWKVHPFREGNTRTIVTFFELMIEDQFIYIDSDLLKDNPNYVRTSLVAANAIFSDIGDRRDYTYLEAIIRHAFENGRKLRNEIVQRLREEGVGITNENIQKVVFQSRMCNHVLSNEEISSLF